MKNKSSKNKSSKNKFSKNRFSKNKFSKNKFSKNKFSRISKKFVINDQTFIRTGQMIEERERNRRLQQLALQRIQQHRQRYFELMGYFDDVFHQRMNQIERERGRFTDDQINIIENDFSRIIAPGEITLENMNLTPIVRDIMRDYGVRAAFNAIQNLINEMAISVANELQRAQI